MSRILAFETSNYTTSVCLFDIKTGIVWENRIMLPVTQGKCGLRQSDAVFLHTRNLKTLLHGIVSTDIDYVASSDCPSERKDSYMPCFTVGVSYASSISELLGVPCDFFSHQKSHIAAAAYSSGSTELLKSDFIAYHVSGGTTDILLCNPYGNTFSVMRIGGTADISCGQLIDRIGTMLGFAFPCGKEVESKSSSFLSGKINITDNELDYNFSGFQNKAQKLFDEGRSEKDICTFALDTVYSFINASANAVRNKYGDIPLLMSGGVMSNGIISGLIQDKIKNIYFSDKYYSVDNACGIAYLCAMERGLLNE